MYYIEHKPTQRFYTPDMGQFDKAGRNWRKTMGTIFPTEHDADTALDTVLNSHYNEKPLRIRDYNGYVRHRDFAVRSI